VRIGTLGRHERSLRSGRRNLGNRYPRRGGGDRGHRASGMSATRAAIATADFTERNGTGAPWSRQGINTDATKVRSD
jgi:hypothetical protein